MKHRHALPALAAMAALMVSPTAVAAAEDALPIFDVHAHYSSDAWAAHRPEAIVAKLDAANVVRALVSSTPDDGTLMLYRHDAGRFVPVLRPYRRRADMAGWFGDADVLAYVEERLGRGFYRGVGEFHLLEEGHARTPQMRRLAALAVERGIMLHVHSGAAPVRALFAIAPEVKILWAHAGMSEPPEVVGELVERYPGLMVELAFRAADVAPHGRLDAAWRALFTRHPDRFMVGSDTYLSGRWDVYPDIIEEHRRWLRQLPRELAEALAWENAARLFGAPEDG